MNLVRDVFFQRLARLVAMGAILLFRHIAMALGRAGVDFMAAETRHRVAAVHDHVAHVVQHMPIGRIDLWVVGQGPVDLKVLEQVIARDEVVRIRQAG